MDGLARLEEADVQVRKVRYHDEDSYKTVFTAVVLEWRPRLKVWRETKKEIVCIGRSYGMVEGDRFHIHAEETEDPRYGIQYQVYKMDRIQPGTELELKKFLMSVKGVGPHLADLLVAEFGLDVFSEIAKDPSCMNRLGLPKSAKEHLYEAIVENEAYEELLMFLQAHGSAPALAADIYRRYSVNAIEKIRDDPYALFLDEIVDFKAADQLGASLDSGADPMFRITAGALACMQAVSEQDGEICVSRASFDAMLTKFLARDGQRDPTADEIEEALDRLVRDGWLIIDSCSLEDPAIYLKSNYYAEVSTAERLSILMTAPKRFRADDRTIEAALTQAERESKIALAEGQRAAVLTALRSPVSVLTGGPGTGKTQTLKMVVDVVKKIDPSADIRLCAPTGKAAVRMRDLTGHEAQTIHRLIGYPQKKLAENELVCDFLIVDEFSMCDIRLCSWVLKGVCAGARVLIVGDHEQLPSIGPGLVLRDLIASRLIPVSRLEEVFRRASGRSLIVENAHSIIQHPPGVPVPMQFSQERGGDFYLIERPTQTRTAKTIRYCVERLLSEGEPVGSIEVLSPVRSGLLGTGELNMALRDLIVPGGIGYMTKTCELKEGDKVIQTSNDYELQVFNGETGIVKELRFAVDKAVLVEFPDRCVWYDADQASELDLAYAITIHRSQGSEFDTAIIPIFDTRSIDRNLLYTAITRAKKRVILVGSREILEKGLRKQRSAKRSSRLIVRLQRALGQTAGHAA